MKALYFMFGFTIGCLLVRCLFDKEITSHHHCQEKDYKEAYLRQNKILAEHDSLFRSGLIINLSKYCRK